VELNDEFDGLAIEIGQESPPTALEHRAILVVGSHRSGTSALARVLSLVGCDLPKHVIPPQHGNELGHWEPEAVVLAHDAFLTNIGSSWDDVAALPEGAFVSAAARELRQHLALLLREEYGPSPLFVVKDPRISRLLPLWFAVLAELQIAPVIVVAVRNPLEVAASLKARDGFTTTKSLLLWLRHTIEAEQHSRGRPRSIVMYDELLRDWQGVVTRLGEDLGVTWPGRSHRAAVVIEQFLSEQHRHHVFDWRDLDGRADVVSWVKEAYFALRASDAVQVLDQVRDQLAQADIAFGPILEETRLELQASQEQTLEVVAARDALASGADARDLALEARAAEVQQLQEEVGRLHDAIGASATQAATHHAELAALQAERDRLAHEVERIAAEARNLTASTEAAEARVDFAHAEAARAREELNTANAEVDRLRTAADEAVSRAAVLETRSDVEREKLLTDLEAARVNIGQLEEQVASANAALGALEAQAAADRGELLRELEQARATAEQLSTRVLAAESEAVAERRQMLAELDAANSETNRLAKQVEDTSHHAEELAATADELLSAADAELEASRAEQNRLRAEITDAVEQHGQLLLLVEHLEAALERATAAVSQREDAAAALAEESNARRVELEAERTRLLDELDATRTNLQNAHTEMELVQNELQMLKSEAADERAAFGAERDAARSDKDSLVAELETARTCAEGLAATAAELEAALDAHRALLHALQSVTNRRTSRRRSLSHLGTWLLPPTPRKLTYLRRYLALRRTGEFDVDSYLLGNPDVLAAGINPLMHYVQYGCGEGRALDGYVEPGMPRAPAKSPRQMPIDPAGGRVPSSGRNEVNPQPVAGVVPARRESLRIAYVLPGLGIGGGVNVVLEHAERLVARGHDVTVLTNENDPCVTWRSARGVQLSSVQSVEDLVKAFDPPPDVLVATGWQTVYEIIGRRLPARSYCYLVQSYEPDFYPQDSFESDLAESTYRLPLSTFTVAAWMERRLKESYGRTALYLRNGLNDIFHTKADPIERRGNRFRVLLEGPLENEMKRLNDAFLAVEGVDAEVWLVTSDGELAPWQRPDRLFRSVALSHMPAIYASCHVIVKLSSVEGMFGPPLEMMSQGGVAITSDVRGHEEYMRDGENGYVVPIGDWKSARRRLRELASDPEAWNRMSKAAEETAAEFVWDPTIDRLEQWMVQVRREADPLQYEQIFSLGRLGARAYMERAWQVGSLDGEQQLHVHLDAEAAVLAPTGLAYVQLAGWVGSAEGEQSWKVDLGAGKALVEQAWQPRPDVLAAVPGLATAAGFHLAYITELVTEPAPEEIPVVDSNGMRINGKGGLQRPQGPQHCLDLSRTAPVWGVGRPKAGHSDVQLEIRGGRAGDESPRLLLRSGALADGIQTVNLNVRSGPGDGLVFWASDVGLQRYLADQAWELLLIEPAFDSDVRWVRF
jgi:glycosyltransferase involved in cell wall biosynthesis